MNRSPSQEPSTPTVSRPSTTIGESYVEIPHPSELEGFSGTTHPRTGPDPSQITETSALSAQPTTATSPGSSQIEVGKASEEHSPERSVRASSVPRQSRPLVHRASARNSFSQSPNRSFSPYNRPHSQPGKERASAMSSAGSSPRNTGSTTTNSGTGSGSNPNYHLPYAPFPYPMPSSGGQSQQGGKGR